MMDEECLNELKWRKIEETVFEILRTTKLERATEFDVRSAAAERVGFDLSEFPYRQLVGQLVDTFLLSTAISVFDTTPSYRDDDRTNSNNGVTGINCENQQKKRKLCDGGDGLQDNYDGKVICKLSDNKRVTIHESNGKTMIAIRNLHIKDGNMYPRKGVNTVMSLTAAEWASFRDSFPSIEEAFAKMESRLRSDAAAKQNDTIMANLLAAENSQVDEAGSSSTRRINYPPIKRKQAEADSSGSAMVSKSQEEHLCADRKQEATGTSSRLIIAAAIFNSHEENPTAERKQTEAAADTYSVGLITTSDAHTKKTEADISTPASEPSPARLLYYNANNNNGFTCLEERAMIPMVQTPRLDGKNYPCWRYHMELFLKQLNLAYVLTEPCPCSIFSSNHYNEHVRDVAAAIQKRRRWVDDDYMCCHHILKSLCDSLFHWYTQKSVCSAGDLWEELRLVYDEDFRTKRSQINKYIHFQMIDGVSILDQVEELHKLADSIIASGTWIEENFHVSVIVSKLPPSWKEFRVRLMHEEVLPVSMLMVRLQVEEKSRRCYYNKREESNYNNSSSHIKFDGRAR